MLGCYKRYTDPSSLRKHVKNHSKEDQEQMKVLKESVKERRRSYPDISLAPDSVSCWTCPTSCDQTANLGLMSGGGLMSQRDHGDHGVPSCGDQSRAGGLLTTACDPRDWQRRLEAEHQYYANPIY